MLSFKQFILSSEEGYDMQWFHACVAEHCQRLLEGDIKNLMVFMPPQHGKSEIVSRKFPAWALGLNPDLKIVGCSYSADLANQFSRAIQRTIDSKTYQSLFPDTYLKGMYPNERTTGYIRHDDYFDIVGHRGFYKSVGVSGSLTGTPVDIAIIDDPVKDALQAGSSTYRKRVWEWYNSVLATRLHNLSKQLLIMTRWHDDDLAGRLLKMEAEDWTVLSIPAICEQEGDNGLSQRKIGDPLWPAKHALAKLLKQKQRGPKEFNAMYQQHPTIEEGNIVKREWFQHCTMTEFRAKRFNEPIHFYLDTAYGKIKPGKDNDPSGILAVCVIRNYLYLVDAMKMQMGMPELLRFLPEYMKVHGADHQSKLNVEPKANGISVVQSLRETTRLNVKETPSPRESKETRFTSVSPVVEAGRVLMVEGTWNEEFLNEVCGFPDCAHDEYVDVLGYAIDDFKKNDDDLSSCLDFVDNLI